MHKRKVSYEKWYKLLCFLLGLALVVVFVVFNVLLDQAYDTIEQYQGIVESYSATLEENTDEWQRMYRELELENLELRDNLESAVAENVSWSEKHTHLAAEYEEFRQSIVGAEIPEFEYTWDELVLLTKCVYAEAGAHHNVSQQYITQVILNRVASGKFPNTITEVIYQKNPVQFSVAYNGMLDNAPFDEETFVNVMKVVVLGCELPSYVQFFYSEDIADNPDEWVVYALSEYTRAQGTVFAYSK